MSESIRLRTFLSALLCFLWLLTSAQNSNFLLGITYQPFIYQNYNHSDWNNRPFSYPAEPNSFNGHAFGLTFQKPLTNVLNIKTEFAYSKQEQKHLLSSVAIENPGGQSTYYYGDEFKTEYDIYKLPIQAGLIYEIGYKSGFYFESSLGLQVSYLNNYKTTYFRYNFKDVNNEIDYSFILNNINYTPEQVDQIYWDESIAPPMYINIHNNTEYIYDRWLFGTLGEFGFKKKINNILLIGLGGRFEYDFTNSEKKAEIIYQYLGGFDGGARPKSHNIRYGLNFSAQYLFW